MRNVECDGGGWWAVIEGHPVAVSNDNFNGSADPCGWKGERLAWTSQPQRPGETLEAMIYRVATKKPCPRCGGRVELIEATS